jgi:PAS domain S-box-containing protein
LFDLGHHYRLSRATLVSWLYFGMDPWERGTPMRSAFETAFTHAPIGIALVDLTGRLVRANDALCRITGYTSDQLCARSLRDLSNPHDVDVDAAQNRDLVGGDSRRIRLRNGSSTPGATRSGCC